MPLLPFPAASRMRWRRVDVPGHEESRMERVHAGWHITGNVEVRENGALTRMQYAIECNDAWRTLAATIQGSVSDVAYAFALKADGQGNWTQDGASLPELAGTLDIDLGFTPATNTLPIRRLRLAVGGVAPVHSAWLRFPELRLEVLEQTYTREADQAYRYHALVDGEPFTARLDTDAYGRVLRYEGLWEAETIEPA